MSSSNSIKWSFVRQRVSEADFHAIQSMQKYDNDDSNM